MADAVDMTKTMAVAGIASAILAGIAQERGIVIAKTMIPEAVGMARDLISEATRSLRVKPLE